MTALPFRKKVVIITGASSGIGYEMSLHCARQGASLALAARNQSALKRLADQCRELGAQVTIIPTDVASREACRQLIDRTIQAFGQIDMLINNAGISMWANFEEVDDVATLEPIMQVNFFGALYCTKYALPYLRATKGRLVGVSSLTGKTGVPTRSVYAASKHAMAGFFDSLRIELGDSGVSVTMAYPGFVTTSIRERALGSDGQPLGASPIKDAQVMDAATCARLILRSAAKRKRELIFTARGKLGVILKCFLPGLVDRMAARAIIKGR